MGVEAEGRERVFLLSVWSDTLLSSSEFLLNRKQIHQMMSLYNFPKYILKKLCAESLSLPSGFDSKASSNWIFRGHWTEHQSVIGQEDPISWLWTFHVQKFNAIVLVTKLSGEIEKLKRDLGWLSKTTKCRKKGLISVLGGHGHLCLALGCCKGIMVSLTVTARSEPRCSRIPTLCSMKDFFLNDFF